MITRFIPARAGNTPTTREPSKQSAVHPRACGEHTGASLYIVYESGSSPRVRGTLPGPDRGIDEQRFIPARAGNTLDTTPWHRKWTVHPRACGEHLIYAHNGGKFDGSSPRVRGTLSRTTCHNI